LVRFSELIFERLKSSRGSSGYLLRHEEENPLVLFVRAAFSGHRSPKLTVSTTENLPTLAFFAHCLYIEAVNIYADLFAICVNFKSGI
jgi:hypothetical protein